MSGVDVLAVWNRAIEMVGGFDDADDAEEGDEPIVAPLIHDMRAAHAAVAELIERMDILVTRQELSLSGEHECSADWINAKRALARCRGGAE